MNPVKLPALYYQQFDADYARDVPAESYGGWKTGDIELAPEHTAVVMMHAWEAGTMEQWPGWRRCVEYHPRALKILAEVFPPLLSAVRASPMRLFHVVGGRDYYSHLPGYKNTLKLAGASPAYPQVAKDATYEAQDKFRRAKVFVGERNWPDVDAGWKFWTLPPRRGPWATS